MSGESKKCSTVEEIVSVVTTIQRSSQIVNSLNRSSISENDEVFFDLYKPGDESSPRYTIYILDKPYRTKKDGEYAAFIVPQGRYDKMFPVLMFIASISIKTFLYDLLDR